jgi:hypothetical protein
MSVAVSAMGSVIAEQRKVIQALSQALHQYEIGNV